MARVLLVDDEPVVRKVMTRILLRAGHQVTEAASLAEARAAAAHDVVVADKNLSDGSGLELLRERGPVVIASGYANEAAAREALDAGAADFLRKPFEELTELNEAVARAIAAPARPKGDPEGIVVVVDPGARGEAIAQTLRAAGRRVAVGDPPATSAGVRAVVVAGEERGRVLEALAAHPRPPVIVVAARGALDEILVALRHGAIGYVVEPSPADAAREVAARIA